MNFQNNKLNLLDQQAALKKKLNALRNISGAIDLERSNATSVQFFLKLISFFTEISDIRWKWRKIKSISLVDNPLAGSIWWQDVFCAFVGLLLVSDTFCFSRPPLAISYLLFKNYSEIWMILFAQTTFLWVPANVTSHMHLYLYIYIHKTTASIERMVYIN